MPVYSKPYEQPPLGTHVAVCVDVEDLGLISSDRWGEQDKVVFSWLIGPKMKDGRHFSVHRRFTNALGKTSHLGPFLRAWHGGSIEGLMEKTPDGNRLDYEMFLGHECMLGLVQSEDGKYVNIGSVVPMPDGMESGIDTSDYTRKQDRPGYEIPEGVRRRDESAVLEVASKIDYPETDGGEEDDLPF